MNQIAMPLTNASRADSKSDARHRLRMLLIAVQNGDASDIAAETAAAHRFLADTCTNRPSPTWPPQMEARI